jgi:predicted PurR-regulated permease PerM
MPENKHLRRALYGLYAAAAIGIAWLVLHFALPWFLPFIVAFIIAHLMEPAVRFLSERYRLRRGFASAACTLVIFAVLVALTSLIIGRAVIELTAFAKDLPALLGNITRTVGVIREKIDGFITSAPPEIQDYLNDALAGFNVKIAELPAALSGKILTLLSASQNSRRVWSCSFFACALGSFFISTGYKEVTGFVLRQIPQEPAQVAGRL